MPSGSAQTPESITDGGACMALERVPSAPSRAPEIRAMGILESTPPSTPAVRETAGGDGGAVLATGVSQTEANVLFSSPLAAHAWSSQLLMKNGSKPVTAGSEGENNAAPAMPTGLHPHNAHRRLSESASLHPRGVPLGNDPPPRTSSPPSAPPFRHPAASRYTHTTRRPIHTRRPRRSPTYSHPGTR